MASKPVNDGAREKQSIRVYTRKGKGQRKQSPFFAFATDENEKANNSVNPPETLAQESADPIAVEETALEVKSQEDVGDSTVAKDSAEKVIDKPLVEAFSQAEPHDDDVSLVATDKSVIQSVTGPLVQDVANTSVGDESVEEPSQSHKTQDDVNTVVVDENSIKEPPESLTQEEDATAVVVDKKAIEAPSETLSVEDISAVVVDKNPIEVSSEEHVHVLDRVEEAHPENLPEREAPDAQQPARRTSDSAGESMPMEEDVDGRLKIHVPSKSKQQKEEIRKKLEDQLNVVRGLVKKIEDKEGEIGA